MVTGGGGERAPDSATIMTTTATTVARMDMFRLVWLFLTKVFRLVLAVWERRQILGVTGRKSHPQSGQAPALPSEVNVLRVIFTRMLLVFGKSGSLIGTYLK